MPEPARARTVIHGQSLLDGSEPYQDLKTLDDFWDLIQEICIQDCPTSGARKCGIVYAMNEEIGFIYPAEVGTDEDSRFEDDGLFYRIEDVRAIACPEESEIEQVEAADINLDDDFVNKACVGWESTADAFDDALSQWEAPSCYTFTHESIK